MNLQNILNEIEKVDGEVIDRLAHVSRRHMFSAFAKKAVAAASPVVLTAAIGQAYGQSTSLPGPVREVLNFALALENLEAEFYNTGLASGSLVPAMYREAFMQIAKHENAHVALLKSVLGSAAESKPTFDFTAKGTFPDVFSNFKTFTAVAQAFEDTGVRAYKGQAGKLKPYGAYLEVALQIHSVEARHAARLRMINMQKGWITGNDGFPPAVYAGEGVTTQLGIDIAALPGSSATIASEAFDEPLTQDQVLAIALQFIKY
jgi:rubrerythrin